MKAAESGYVEMILFSINPAFDMLPASENIDTMFADEFDAGLKGTDPDRAKLYKTCEEHDVGITVMKGFAGGRLFDAKRSPFGVCLTPVQCIHYALTRRVSVQSCAGMTRRNRWMRQQDTRRLLRKRKTMRPCLRTRRFTPTAGSAPTADTASRVSQIWTLP